MRKRPDRPIRALFCLNKKPASASHSPDTKGVRYEKHDVDKQQKYDNLKNEYCIKNNIPLIRIPYWEKDNISEILTDIFICKNLNSKFIVNNNMGE